MPIRVFQEGQMSYEQWVEDFEFYVMGLGLTEEKDSARCLGLFVTFGGRRVKETWALNKGKVKAQVEGAEVSEYRHARNVVDEVLKVGVNQALETFQYRNIKQRSGEEFTAFVHRCQVGVNNCGFHVADAERHIRDQVVFGTSSAAVREKALSENLDLKELMKRGQGMESSARFEGASMRVKEEPVFALYRGGRGGARPDRGGFRSDRGGSSRGRSCYKCGEDFPHDGDCPAVDHRCEICRRYGHYRGFCNFKERGRGGQRRGFLSGYRGGRGRANAVHEEEHDEEVIDEQVQSLQAATNEDLYVFAASENFCKSTKGKINVIIDNKVSVSFLPDTGASVNIIDRSTYEVLCQSGVYPLFESRTRIFAYGSDDPLRLRGYFNAKGCFNGESVILTIYVLNARNCGNLLSRTSCEELKVVEVCVGVKGVRERHVSGVINPNISDPGGAIGYCIGSNPSHISGGVVNNISGVKGIKAEGSETIAGLMDRFPSGVGRMKGVQLRLNIDEAVRPVIQPPRRIPFSARAVVEEKLDEMLREDIIEKVDEPTVWLSPVHIVKSPEKVRMVVDMSVANRAIQRTRRVLPTPEEVLCELDGAQYFSKIDLNSAYHQIELHEESRYITTFSTHCGTYRFKTLFFGCSSASEEFDDNLKGKLSGLRGVKNIADDILAYGKTREEHDANLKALLLRLLEEGITVNKKKCVMGVKEVSFFGHWVSGEGVRPMIKDTMREIQRPQNKAEVRSYMGLVNFIGKYIPNFSSIVSPISKMLGKYVSFEWGSTQEEAFQAILREIKSPRMLQHFDPNKQTEVIVDASPVGLCALLTQEGRLVLCVSRKLSKVEARYSQTEREALAIVWSCERLHFYLYGIDFVVLSDHQPLEVLYSPKGRAAARILRWYIRLLPYRFVVKYRKGADNPADYFSRKPVAECSGEEESLATETECFVNAIIMDSVPNAITLQEVIVESLRDPTMVRLRECVSNGKWSEPGMQGYKQVRKELMCKNGVVLRGTRMVLPPSLRGRAIGLAHATHLGMTRTKQYIRSKLWWPGLDTEVEEMIKRCTVCLSVNPEGGEKLEPLRITPFPERPFSTVHIDLFGPLPSGETILGVIDEFSKWPELFVLKGGVSTEDVVGALDGLFARYGYVDQVVSDNGPQFRSWRFENYMQEKGIRHHLITPYYPEGNSSIERFFRNLKKFVKVCTLQGQELRAELSQFLRMYRSTPSRGTGRTPASVILSYEPRTDFPQARESTNSKQFQGMKSHNEGYKWKAKQYTDQINNRRESSLKAGDVVLMRNLCPRKADPLYLRSPLTVLHRLGNQVEIKAQTGKVYRRPLSHLKIVPPASVVREVDTLRDTVDRERFRDNVLNNGGLGSVPPVVPEGVERTVSVPVIATPVAVSVRRSERVPKPVIRYSPGGA